MNCGAGGCSYPVPIPKMVLRAIFLLIAIFRPQRTGMGKTTTMASRNRLRIPMKRSKDI